MLGVLRTQVMHEDAMQTVCHAVELTTVKSRIQYARFSPKIEVWQPGCV